MIGAWRRRPHPGWIMLTGFRQLLNEWQVSHLSDFRDIAIEGPVVEHFMQSGTCTTVPTAITEPCSQSVDPEDRLGYSILKVFLPLKYLF